ncbi:MAG: flagellar biosynthetic protein FliO [Gammaproteobacteria bacterium]|nr:flagellar biosynthetic protein FliO [Gammaproteobacteria bacterium]
MRFRKMKHAGTAHALLAGAILFPVVAAASGTAPDPMAAGNLLQLLFGLLVVLAAIGVAGFLLRRLGRLPQGNAPMRIMGGLNLGARERAVLVQVGDKQILLGVAPGRVQTLLVLEKPLEENTLAPSGAMSFAERLAQRMKGGPS